jgi:FixJ family two-component response regulator
MGGTGFTPSLQARDREGILQIAYVVSIVDDDRSIRLALGSLIRSLGWQVRMYESAEEFLASGEAVNTACLISDVLMPGMSGIEMYEQLRAQGHAPSTIFITACPSASLETQVMSAGALVLLPKPYDTATLTHWVSLALRPF